VKKKKATGHRLQATGRKNRAKPAKRAKPATRAKPAKRAKRRVAASRWVKFVQKHGVVLASARGPVPNIAEAVAGEPIVGSWWAHAKGRAIFAALSDLDDSEDVRCFKLVDGKVTLVHRRAWPALVRLARAGVLAADRVASVQQEHLPTGEHRNFTTPFPDWVDDATARAAEAVSVDDAVEAFPRWLRPGAAKR
jgi:hypothetical protein